MAAIVLSGWLRVGPLLAGDADVNIVDDFRQLADLEKNKDWSQDHVRIEQMIDGLFAQRGWTGESDEFARKLALDVSSIPPWQPLDRFNRFYEQIVKRYQLTDDNAVQLKAKMTREAGRFLLRHGGLVLRQLKEGLSTRAANKPFTPEQIARWTKASQPIISEVQETVERMCEEIQPLLDANAREILARDLQSFQKRHQVVEGIVSRWSQGKWTPKDWGLDNDPAYAAWASITKEARPTPSRHQPIKIDPSDRAATQICRTHEPSSWDACVVQFETRFDLDIGQQSTAESILVELRIRAEDYLRSHEDQVKGVPRNARDTHQGFSPIRAIYQELNDRLEALLTSGQRSQSGK